MSWGLFHEAQVHFYVYIHTHITIYLSSDDLLVFD